MEEIKDHHNKAPSNSPEPVDPDAKVKRPWQAWLSGSPVLFLSILLHLLFAILATLFIVQRIHEKRKQNFTEVTVTTNSSAAAAAKHQTQVTQKKNAMTTPDIVHSITVAEMSAVTLPEVPLPADSSPSGAGKLDGTSLNGAGLGNGTGTGTIGKVSLDVSAIAATVFGMPDGRGAGLTGYFYDLKQTKNRTSTNMNVERYSDVIMSFMHGGWTDNYFHQYFRGPKALYLANFFIPYIWANDGPKSFDLADLVQPRQWVILYHGKFTIPHSGTFRFVGFGNDIDEVAIDHRTVLDASIIDGIPNHDPKPTATYTYLIPSDLHADRVVDGYAKETFHAGNWIDLEENHPYEIQILIGERPGNMFGAWLMVEEKDKTYQKTAEGAPILPMLRFGHVNTPMPDMGNPPWDKNADLGWQLYSDPDTQAADASDDNK